MKRIRSFGKSGKLINIRKKMNDGDTEEKKNDTHGLTLDLGMLPGYASGFRHKVIPENIPQFLC